MGADTLERVIAIATFHSGVKHLHADSALDQDMRISGDDIDEFAETLAKEFRVDVARWPWDRFANLSEPSIFTVVYLLWRLMTWPIRGRLFDPSRYERLELGHIAAVIEKGEWIDP